MSTQSLFARRTTVAAAALARLWWTAGLLAAIVAAAAGGRALRLPPARDGIAVDRPGREELLSRATRRALSDARRCARELRVLAQVAPGTVARALELEPPVIAQAAAGDGIASLDLRTIAAREAVTEASANGLAAATSAGGADRALLAARAHATAERLCLAREAASAATLGAHEPNREELLGATTAAPHHQ